MINSRKIDDLDSKVAALCRAFIADCKKDGITIIITSSYRDKASQAALYAQGRTKPGPKVTNAKPGQSFHNFKVAFDFAPVINGHIVWADIAAFKRCGEIGKRLGLEYGGDWRNFKDYAHLQYTGGLTLADFNAGKTIA